MNYAKRLGLAKTTKPNDIWLLRGTGEPVKVQYTAHDMASLGIVSECGLCTMITEHRLATDYEQFLPQLTGIVQ